MPRIHVDPHDEDTLDARLDDPSPRGGGSGTSAGVVKVPVADIIDLAAYRRWSSEQDDPDPSGGAAAMPVPVAPPARLAA